MQYRLITGATLLFNNGLKNLCFQLKKTKLNYLNKNQFSTTKRCLDSNTFVHSFMFNRGTQNKWKQQDKIPDNYKLIYYHKQLMNYSVKLFMTRVILMAAPGIFLYALQEDKTVFLFDYENYPLTPGMCKAIFVCLLVYSILLNYFFPRMVLRIYKHLKENTYVILTPSSIPFRTVTTKFDHNNNILIKPNPFSNFLHLYNNVTINKKSFIIFEDDFGTPMDYYNFVSKQ